MNQISQQRSIYLLHIAHETIINLFHRTLYRSDHIHIRPGQSKSVPSTGLQAGNNILVYQTTIHHRYHFQRFRIGNTTTIYHFAFNTQLCGNLCCRATTAVNQHFMSADGGKVIQQLKKGGFLFYDFSTHLNYS